MYVNYLTKENFAQHKDELLSDAKQCDFIAVDTEFGALPNFDPMKSYQHLNISEIYKDFKTICDANELFQIGLSMFTYNAEKHSYDVKIYSIYLSHCSGPIEFLPRKNFTQQPSSKLFLRKNEFNFNKQIIEGVSYLKKKEISEIIKYFKVLKNLQCTKIYTELVTYEWHYLQFANIDNIEEYVIENYDTFSNVFRTILSYDKIFVGNVFLVDIMSMYSSFVQELPDSLEEFKHEMEIYLDGIYDTNAIMKLFQCIVSNKEHSNVYIPKGLLKSFDFFNNKEFLKKHPNLPKFDIIKVCEEANDVFDLYHDAGYDSYATGNVFINQCIYAFIHQHESNKNVVLNMEQLFRVVEKVKWKISLIFRFQKNAFIDIKKPEKNKEKKFIYNIKLKLKEMDLDTIAFIIRKLHSSTTEIKSDNQILVVVFDSHSNSRFKKFLNQNQQHISFTEVIDDSLH